MNMKPLFATFKKIRSNEEGLRILLTTEDGQDAGNNEKMLSRIEAINKNLSDLSSKIDSFADDLNFLKKAITLLEKNDKAIVAEICKVRDYVNISLNEHYIQFRVKPLLNEIADFVVKLKNAQDVYGQSNDTDSVKRIAVIIDSFVEHLRVNCGVELIIPEKESTFDESLHIAETGVETEDPDLNRKIYRTHKAGVSYQGKTLKAAYVAVYRYEETNT